MTIGNRTHAANLCRGALIVLFTALASGAPALANCATPSLIEPIIAAIANDKANAAMTNAWTTVVPNVIDNMENGPLCAKLNAAFGQIGTACYPGQDIWIHPGAAPTIVPITAADVCVTSPDPNAFVATVHVGMVWAPPENNLGDAGTDAEIKFQRRGTGIHAESKSLSGSGSATMTLAGVLNDGLKPTGLHIDQANAAVDMQVHFLIIGSAEINFQPDITSLLQTVMNSAFTTLSMQIGHGISAKRTALAQSCVAQNKVLGPGGCQSCRGFGLSPNAAGDRCIVKSCTRFGYRVNDDQSACVAVCATSGTKLHQVACQDAPGLSAPVLICMAPDAYSALAHQLNANCAEGKSPVCSHDAAIDSIGGVKLVTQISATCGACPPGFHGKAGGGCVKCPGDKVWSIQQQECVEPGQLRPPP